MNEAEFARIAEVARTHWWYTTLHKAVARALPEHAQRLLDVGAGSGATLAYLREARPALATTGVEPSAVGRAVAARSGITLSDGHFEDFGPEEGKRFDAILTLDCLYYLRTDARVEAFAERVARHLTPSGVWIGQVAAFPSLRGRHDAWVDCERRFRGAELVRLFSGAGFRVTYRYRYQTLSPLVFLARRVVEPLMREQPESDVTAPSTLANRALTALVRFEDARLSGALARLYGSSVFWVAERV